MRNGQNKRMRGRNRKGGHHHHQNPLSRMYESNGPDIKICGTASHVAEKYLQLARDAQSSGDPVAAENYYQHAEHYFRLIAAAQEQFRQSQPYGYQQGGDQRGNTGDDGYDDGDEQPSVSGEPFAPREQQPFYIGAGLKQVPAYGTPVTGFAQVQALTAADLRHLDGLNIQGATKSIILRGELNAAVRAHSQGGDMVTLGADTFLTVAVLEQWPLWTRAAIQLQSVPV